MPSNTTRVYVDGSDTTEAMPYPVVNLVLVRSVTLVLFGSRYLRTQ
jgi:hypothetical protein